jgi:hypothetical protein
MSCEEWRFSIEERMARLEYDEGLPRDEAERQAIAEYLDRVHAVGRRAPGIGGELDRAAQGRFDPLFQQFEARVGIRRGLGLTPSWGYSTVIFGGDTYRPAERGEPGDLGIITPCFDSTGLADLVAYDPRARRIASRLGGAAVLGLIAVDY